MNEIKLINFYLQIVENDSQEVCRFWDKVKVRSDLCGYGDKASCFADWERIFKAVEKLKGKVGL